MKGGWEAFGGWRERGVNQLIDASSEIWLFRQVDVSSCNDEPWYLRGGEKDVSEHMATILLAILWTRS